MVKLKLPGLALGVEKVGNGRATQLDGVLEHAADGSVEPRNLRTRQPAAETRRMNPRAPQAFVRIDVANPAQETLVEKQCLDSRAARAKGGRESFLGDFKRVGPERSQGLAQRSFEEKSHAAESPRVCVAQFATIIEREYSVCMLCERLLRMLGSKMTGHPQVDKQSRALRVAVRWRKSKQEELPVARHALDSPSGQIPFDRRRIIHEIRLPQPHR